MNNIEIIGKAENSGEAVRRSIRQAAADHQAMGSLLMGLYTMKHACPLYITHGMPKEVIMPEKLMEGLANHPDVIKAHAEGLHRHERGQTPFFAIVDDFPFYEPGKEPKGKP